jgi:hypothetical protein
MGGLAIAYIRLLVLDPSSGKTIRSLTPLHLKYLITLVSLATSVIFLGYEISQALTIADVWERRARLEIRLAAERKRWKRMEGRLQSNSICRWREIVHGKAPSPMLSEAQLGINFDPGTGIDEGLLDDYAGASFATWKYRQRSLLEALERMEALVRAAELQAETAEDRIALLWTVGDKPFSHFESAQPGTRTIQQTIGTGVLDDTAVASSVQNWRRQLAELRASQDPLYWKPDSPSAPVCPAPAHTRVAASIRRASSVKVSSSRRHSTFFGQPVREPSVMHVGRYMGEPVSDNLHVCEPDTPQTEDTRIASSIRRRASDPGLSDDDRLTAAIAQWRSSNAIPISNSNVSIFSLRAPFREILDPSRPAATAGNASVDTAPAPSALHLQKSTSGSRRFSLKFDLGAFMAASRGDGRSSDDQGSESEKEPSRGMAGFVANTLMRGSSRRAPFEVAAGALGCAGTAAHDGSLVSAKIVWDKRTGNARLSVSSRSRSAIPKQSAEDAVVPPSSSSSMHVLDPFWTRPKAGPRICSGDSESMGWI